MHRYEFDVKFFAVIKLNAPDQSSAEKHLERLVHHAEIEFRTDKEWQNSTLFDSGLYMDDEGFPFLTLIDDKELWEIEEQEEGQEIPPT